MTEQKLTELMQHISPRYKEEAAARAAKAKPRFSLMGAAGVLAGAAMCAAVIGGVIYASRQNMPVETAMNSAEDTQTVSETTTTAKAEDISIVTRISQAAVNEMPEETTVLTAGSTDTTAPTAEPGLLPPDNTSAAAETADTKPAETAASTSLLPYRHTEAKSDTTEAKTTTAVTAETRSTVQNDVLSYVQTVSADEILNAEISAYPPSKTVTLSDEQIRYQLLPLLHDVKLYEEDNSYGEYGGQYIGISLKLKNGQKVELGSMSPFFVVNRTGYKASYDACQLLSQFANAVIYEEEPEQNEYPDLTATIKKLTAGGCIVQFENHSTVADARYGLWYRIYHAEDDTPCDDIPQTFAEVLMEIPAGGKAELPISWAEHYGKLTSGEYYVLLNAHDKNGNTLRVDFIID